MRTFGLSDLLTLLSAFQWTLILTAISLAFGLPLAAFIAAIRTSRFRLLRLFGSLVVQLIQGIPALGLVFFFFYGTPVFLGVQVPAIVSVSIAFTVFTGAFLGEIWRGGIEAVRKEQWEAAACLGLSRWHQFRYVIAPQAFRIVLPPTVGFLAQLIKNTSLASVVGFVELARAGQLISAATFQPLLSYTAVAAFYFIICFSLTSLARHMEAKLDVAR